MPGPPAGIGPSWALSVAPSLGNPLPETMEALTIHRDRYGPPSESLRIERVPVPRLRGRDAKRVLVSVLATGPNFNTNFAALGLPVPVFGRGDAARVHIPGSDALGIVVDAGAAVSRVRAGQAVILDSWTGSGIRGYETHDGFHAQFAAVDEERAIPLPAPLLDRSPERLAAMLLTYGTAYRAVVEKLGVSPGDSVLVLGGGKGTSFAGAQIAKSLGARVILMGSNPALGGSLVERGIADSFVDRRRLPPEVFGPAPSDESYEAWLARTEPFRQAVFAANAGRPVDRIFEHTGASNFPLLVSALSVKGVLAFFGATGKGVKGEYRESFFHDGNRYVFDARWVWMRQKHILFRKSPPSAIFSEIGLLPGRRGLVWGADAYSRAFARAGLSRGAELAFVASHAGERKGIAALRRMGIPSSRVIDRDAFDLRPDMPDPLTSGGKTNPEYAAGFLKNAQALGKAYWGIFGARQSPDFVVDRPDQSTLHYSSFVARDHDERNAMPYGFVLFRGKSDLSILGSHMYRADQAAEVVRLLAEGKIVMDQEDLEIVPLAGLPAVQQKMLDGTMEKPKGVALVQADRAGRAIREFEDAFLGERLRAADPRQGRFLEIRLLVETAVLTLTRPEALNALNGELLSQLSSVLLELSSRGTIDGRRVEALVLAGAGRAFVAGADVKEFLGKTADAIGAMAASNIAVFTDLENLPVPVVAVVDGFALGGGNELAMCAHYRLATENASMGQPEVKLGIIPGYGGMQRLPRLVGPERAASMSANGEPIDGYTAVEWGLADEFVPSATALPVAVRRAREIRSGERTASRRNWDEAAGAQGEALRRLLDRPDVREILAAPDPGPDEAKDLSAARRTAAGRALLAMRQGYEHGFSAGLAHDARAFGEIAASPGGQEWIGRFLGKDPVQSSFLELIPPEKPR